jgi:outer membrane protein assembly factor BamB
MVRPRLWPAAAVLVLGALWVGKAWLVGDAVRQWRVVETIVASLVVLLLLVVWLALFSRLPRKTRLAGTAAALAAIACFPLFFRVRGVTGDLRPIVESRFDRPVALPEPPAGPSVAPAEATAGRSGEPVPAPPPAAATARDTAASAPDDPAQTPAAVATPAARTPQDLTPAFPQFLGPSRDGTIGGPRLARDWTARPPRRLWRQPIGQGWSGFAVAGGIAVTQEQRGDEERVVAYDARSGRPLWSHAERARYETVIAGVGPRAVPAIEGGRVIAMGATGVLSALELASGARLWSRNVLKETDAALPEWGRSCSPLVVDGRVVVIAGGSGGRRLVAYDAATGERAWSSGEGSASYSSPMLATLAGRRQVVVLNAASVSGHDPATGAVLWEQPFPREQPNVALPLVLGPDRLLVSAGYGVGSKAYRLAETGGGVAASLEWESPRLKSKFANLVLHAGYVYGLDDGVLTCLDPANGERRWKAGRHGHGQLLLVAGLLLVQIEQGELVLVEPSPEAYRELARFPVLEGKTWNPPALAGSTLLVRNDREAAAYELPVE